VDRVCGAAGEVNVKRLRFDELGAGATGCLIAIDLRFGCCATIEELRAKRNIMTLSLSILSRTCLAALLILGSSAVSLASKAVVANLVPQARDLVWRTPSHDGVNCSYVMLRMFGLETAYGDLMAEFSPAERATSLALLQQVCGEHGLPLIALKQTPYELNRESLPVVVHISSHLSAGGALHIIVARDAEGFVMMNGATASVFSMDTDEFRRTWSGYVLRPQRGSRWLPIAAGAGIVVLSFSYLWNCRPTEA
jgi:hypothetical protein